MPVVASITPTQSDFQTALRSFLLDALPAGVDVVTGLANRVPEPKVTAYVEMTPIIFKRLATNYDSYDDCRFEGSIVNSVLTVSNVDHGKVQVGRIVFGVGVADGTQILSQTSGAPGGAGTYQVSNSQTFATQVLAAGAHLLKQSAEVTVQLDFHSADLSAGDMAQTISTAFRDMTGVDFFESLTPKQPITPLYADDPKEVPFINDQQQYEWRWVLSACLQVDQTIAVAQQFADKVDISRLPVDLFYVP